MSSIDVQDWVIIPNDGFPDEEESRNQQYKLPTKHSIMTYFLNPVYTDMADRAAPEPMSTDTVPTEAEENNDAQDIFKKLKETEFVENKVNCPWSSIPDFHFEKGKPRGNSKADIEGRRDSFNIWILSLLGMAAAGVSIIISWSKSNKQRHEQKQHRRE